MKRWVNTIALCFLLTSSLAWAHGEHDPNASRFAAPLWVWLVAGALLLHEGEDVAAGHPAVLHVAHDGDAAAIRPNRLALGHGVDQDAGAGAGPSRHHSAR